MARSPFKRRKAEQPAPGREGSAARIIQSNTAAQAPAFNGDGSLSGRLGGQSIREKRTRSEAAARAMNSLGAAFVDGLGSSAQRFNRKVPTADKASQILAGLTLPFFVVVAMKAAEALMEIVRSSVPDSFILAGAAGFLVGFALLVGVAAFSFAWVKSGGFRLFHDLF